MSKRVYKFLSAQYGVEDIEKRRVKIATIDDLNDPYDLACVDTAHPALDQALENFIRWFRGRRGLLCFSRNWDNILLWSHYACSHTGMCLGFDIPDKQPDGDYGLDVAYQPNLLRPPRIEDVNFDFAQRFLRTKHDMWAYEQELRLFVALNDPPDERRLNWFQFGPDLELKEIIVGARPTPETSLQNAYEPYADRVDLWWAYLKKDAFSLSRMKRPPGHLNG